MTYLGSGWQFGSHHFFTVESATIRHECAITDGMDHPLLLTGFVDIGCNTLQHDNAVALDNIDDLAFDVGEAFENKRCPDMSGINGRSEARGSGKSVWVRVELGGRRIIKKKTRSLPNYIINKHKKIKT